MRIGVIQINDIVQWEYKGHTYQDMVAEINYEESMFLLHCGAVMYMDDPYVIVRASNDNNYVAAAT